MSNKSKKFVNKKVLLLSRDTILEDPRVNRMYQYLKNKNLSLQTISSKKENIKNHKIFKFNKKDRIKYYMKKNFFIFFFKILQIKLLNLKTYCLAEINVIKNLNLELYDYIFVFDLKFLYAVSQTTNKKNIIWDAREYYPEHFNQLLLWRFIHKEIIKKLIRLSIKKVMTGITVSQGLKKKYYENFKIKLKVKLSVPIYKKLKFRPVSKKISIIHHGLCSETRKIENFFELGKKLGVNYDVFLMLKIVNKKYYEYLKKKYSNVRNVRFLRPVELKEITKKINFFDIGLIIGLNTSVNHFYSMPNKLFEYIQAGLCVISNPLHDVKRFVKQNKVGYVSSSFKIDDISDLIKSLTFKDITKAKKNSIIKAKKFNHKILFRDLDKTLSRIFK